MPPHAYRQPLLQSTSTLERPPKALQLVICASEHFFQSEHLPPPHISSDLFLPDFWCALDACEIYFSKYRFFAKSGIFVWW